MQHITPLHRLTTAIIVVVALAANIVGYAWNLYHRIPWFDEVLHAYTIFAITLPLGVLLYGVVLTNAHRRPFVLALVIASLGVALGGLWEIAEWAFDQYVSGNVILGKLDTIIDLIVDTLGALVAGWLVVAMVRSAADDDS